MRDQEAGLVLKEVSEFYNISIPRLKSKRRQREIVYARQIVMYLCRTKLKLIYEDCGEIFKLNHATALHACKNIKNQMEFDKEFKSQVEYISANLDKRFIENSIVVRDIDLLTLCENYTSSFLTRPIN